jgi:hypothetical protein
MKMEAVKLKATLFWCQHNKVNEMSQKFEVKLCHLSDAAVEALETMGIDVREKDEMGKYITCKSSKPIKVVDTDGDEINEDIGNGSKAKAIVSSYEWKYKNKKGVSPSIKKLVVTEHVEFGAGKGGASLNDDEVL